MKKISLTVFLCSLLMLVYAQQMEAAGIDNVEQYTFSGDSANMTSDGKKIYMQKYEAFGDKKNTTNFTVYDRTTGTTDEFSLPRPHSNQDFLLSPKGKYLVSAGYYSAETIVASTIDKKIIYTLSDRGERIVFDRNDTLMAVTNYNSTPATISVYQLQTGTKLFTKTVPDYPNMTFDKDGKILILGHQQDYPYEFIDAASGKELYTIDPEYFGNYLEVQSMELSPDGKKLYIAKPHELSVLDMTTKTFTGLVWNRSVNFLKIKLHPNGKDLLVSTVNGIYIYDLSTSICKYMMPLTHGSPFTLSDDGNWLLTPNSSGATLTNYQSMMGQGFSAIDILPNVHSFSTKDLLIPLQVQATKWNGEKVILDPSEYKLTLDTSLFLSLLVENNTMYLKADAGAESYFRTTPAVVKIKAESSGYLSYIKTERTYVFTGWLNIRGQWYYLDENGFLQDGWQTINGKSYFFDGNIMKTNWFLINGKWYYFNSNGSMKTGWLQSNSKWYFLKENGQMQTAWLKSGGKWYYFNGNGVMQTGWLKLSGQWYYLDQSGAMKTGWLKLNNQWYFLDQSGAMKIGWQTINGKKYYFNSGGVWVK
ncbi:hypothetical protein ACFVSW_04760 [Neobacillus sp. NPDC058068]|uniref:hypothetical protein n=1 Tax=Neobacillus sp. NPDC058068 TaxID=3346325 RepID=UPI0036D9D2C7